MGAPNIGIILWECGAQQESLAAQTPPWAVGPSRAAARFLFSRCPCFPEGSLSCWVPRPGCSSWLASVLWGSLWRIPQAQAGRFTGVPIPKDKREEEIPVWNTNSWSRDQKFFLNLSGLGGKRSNVQNSSSVLTSDPGCWNSGNAGRASWFSEGSGGIDVFPRNASIPSFQCLARRGDR